MQKLLEKCKGIIEDSLYSASDAELERPDEIVKLREQVKNEIKRQRLVDNTMTRVLQQVSKSALLNTITIHRS
jgi:hypothetical protein